MGVTCSIFLWNFPSKKDALLSLNCAFPEHVCMINTQHADRALLYGEKPSEMNSETNLEFLSMLFQD